MKKAQQHKCFNPNTKIKCTTFMLKTKYFRKNMHFKWNVDGKTGKKERKTDKKRNMLSCKCLNIKNQWRQKLNPTILGTFQKKLYLKRH